MQAQEYPVETETENAKKRELLRLIVAIFYMALAMRLLPDMGGIGLFHAILPPLIAPHAYAIVVFTAAWFILAGQRLPIAAAVLIAFTIMSQAFVPPAAAEFSILRQVVLVTSLMLVGGYFDKQPVRASNPGRIRLVRVAPKHRPRKAAAKARGSARSSEQPNHRPAKRSAKRSGDDKDTRFAPIPEEMDVLFDQIAITR